MKTINQNELLSLNDTEKAKILKEICLGRIKYIGKDKKWVYVWNVGNIHFVME